MPGSKKMTVRDAAPEPAPIAIPKPKPNTAPVAQPEPAVAIFERQCYGYGGTYQSSMVE
jgi:hypothetical protein